jgi:hypothetical protein
MQAIHVVICAVQLRAVHKCHHWEHQVSGYLALLCITAVVAAPAAAAAAAAG